VPPAKRAKTLNGEDFRHAEIQKYRISQESAYKMVGIISQLASQRGVIVKLFGQDLQTSSVQEVINAHEFANANHEVGLKPNHTLAVLQATYKAAGKTLGPMRFDLGRLTQKWLRHSAMKTDQLDADDEKQATEIGLFVQKCLKEDSAKVPALVGKETPKPVNVVLYGFGRIGRLLARILIEKAATGYPLHLRGIVVREPKGGPSFDDLQKRASLFEHDSVHGDFKGNIILDKERHAMIANGNVIQLIYSASPSSVDYTAYGIADAIVVDNTGIWTDRKGLSQHLQSKGAAKAVLTAPAKGGSGADVPMIVAGVNYELVSQRLKAGETIFSCASCTTNAIAPFLATFEKEWGIDGGHVETVHSFTNDQNIIDNYHKKDRRGRAAPLNMVMTSTGAAKAVVKIVPSLAGKLTANAIRVPTPDVSLAILALTLKNNGPEISKEVINEHFKKLSLGVQGSLQDQIEYRDSTELASTDLLGNKHAGILDSASTIVQGGRCTMYVWYDNEFGYSCQVVRCIEHIAGVNCPLFPSES